MNDPSIYAWIESEEARFQTDEIRVGDNWLWNFRNHVQLIFHLKNGVFFTGANDYSRAFKAVMEPILNLAYWTEDIEVKDVVFFIENGMGRVQSFFVKKYHDEVYVRKHDLDTLFDEVTESDLDYGGVLVQKTNQARPEVLQLNTIAFCDQTDILGSPRFFKHNFSPDSLRSMSKAGWGEEKNGATISLDELCVLAQSDKTPDGQMGGKRNQVPGKSIEVYIGSGDMPEAYLKDNDNMEDYYPQVQIVAYYYDKKSKRQGVTLYRKRATDDSIKFHTTKKVQGRALGRGAGEQLIHPQVWTNFLEIHKTNMLAAASKVPLYTDDQNYTARNKIQDMENLEITTVGEGKKIYQVPTAAPANIQLFAQGISEWYEQAQTQGAAFDPLMGKEGASGTTFKGQERSVAQGRGLHDRRRGQRAKFIEEMYRDWIIPDMKKEMLSGTKFLATLTSEEMDWLTTQLSENYANRHRDQAVLNGEVVRDKEELKQEFLQSFTKKGNKHLLEIVKEELRDVEIKIGINVAAKQKDLVGLSDKLLSIFQFIFTNPQGFLQAMQIPALATSFNDILEFSGISQANFSTLMTAAKGMVPPGTQPAPGQGQPPQPLLAQPAPQAA